MTLQRWGALMLLAIAYSAVALGFLLGGLAMAAVLTARGYGMIADVLVLNYLLLSLPIFLAQIGVVADVMLIRLGNESVVVPALIAVGEHASAGPATRTLAAVLTTVSLFSSISMTALSLVLPPTTVLDLVRTKYRIEAGILAATVDRFVSAWSAP
jgi:hypothetical protein